MAITEAEFAQANGCGEAQRAAGYAVSARHNRHRDRIIVTLNTSIELTIPVGMVEGLAGADAADLGDIHITPSGLGLHWPRLDADLSVAALMQGLTGSRHWMARELGAKGGKVVSAAKSAAARENGKRGGRPKRHAAA